MDDLQALKVDLSAKREILAKAQAQFNLAAVDVALGAGRSRQGETAFQASCTHSHPRLRRNLLSSWGRGARGRREDVELLDDLARGLITLISEDRRRDLDYEENRDWWDCWCFDDYPCDICPFVTDVLNALNT